jgi:hypothetical protein
MANQAARGRERPVQAVDSSTLIQERGAELAPVPHKRCQAGNGEMRTSHVQAFQFGSRCAGPNIASGDASRSERLGRLGPEATVRGIQ